MLVSLLSRVSTCQDTSGSDVHFSFGASTAASFHSCSKSGLDSRDFFLGISGCSSIRNAPLPSITADFPPRGELMSLGLRVDTTPHSPCLDISLITFIFLSHPGRWLFYTSHVFTYLVAQDRSCCRYVDSHVNVMSRSKDRNIAHFPESSYLAAPEAKTTFKLQWGDVYFLSLRGPLELYFELLVYFTSLEAFQSFSQHKAMPVCVSG